MNGKGPDTGHTWVLIDASATHRHPDIAEIQARDKLWLD